MQVTFGDERLQALYRTGKSRKGKLPAELIKKFCLRVQILESAENIYDLRNPVSLNFEKMKGHESRFSLRLNDQYRLEFEIVFEDDARTRGRVIVMKLSDHYGGNKW
jgi:proteic killer suppression protein